MATLSPRKRGLDGLRVRPVARIRTTHHIPGETELLDLRWTLRSDGAVLRSVYIPAGPWPGSRSKWTGHSIHGWLSPRTTAPNLIALAAYVDALDRHPVAVNVESVG